MNNPKSIVNFVTREHISSLSSESINLATQKIIRINLANVQDKEGLMEELAHKFEFPAYFGKNWDAVDECLRDLEDPTGWLVVIDCASDLMRLPAKEPATLISVLKDAGEFWRQQGRRFDVLVVGDETASTFLGLSSGE